MDEQQNDQNGQQPVEQDQQVEQPQENIADAPAQPVDTQPRQVPPPPISSNNLMKFGLIGIGVLVLLFIFFLAFNWRFSRQPGGTPTPTPIQKVVVEPMSQWQTYKAGSMSVKHSATWKLDKPEEGIFVTERDSQADKGTLNPGKGWLEIVRSDKTLDQLKPRGGIDSQKNIEINGQDGVRFEGSNTGIANATYYVQAFFQRNDGLYKVHFFSQDKSLKEEFLKEFDQILSTVTFSDAVQAVDTSSWKTYSDTKMAFKYPADWTASSNQNSVSLKPTGTQSTVIDIYTRPDKNQLDLKKEFEAEQAGNIKTKRDVQLGAASGTEYSGCFGVEGCVNQYMIIADTAKNRYQITYYTDLQPDKSLYSTFLSTLTFTQ